jgi:hypothetical protein
MTPIDPTPDPERPDAARLALTLLRVAGAAAHPYPGHTPPGQPRIGTEAFVFLPSWTSIPIGEVESFLVSLPSPALLSSTLIRGVINLFLLEELSGDRRRWAEKTLSNQVACFDSMCTQQGLTDNTRVLLEFEEESHIFPLPTIRYWARQMAVDIGWTLNRLDDEPRAGACLLLMRADGNPFRGRSSMLRPGWRRSSGDAA